MDSLAHMRVAGSFGRIEQIKKNGLCPAAQAIALQ